MSFPDLLELFQATLRVSLPTFAWVVLGLILHRIGWLSVAFNDKVSRLAFNFGLPVMLFTGAAQVDYTHIGQARYLLSGVISTLLVLTLSWGYSRWRRHPRPLQGLFVQAAFRSNLAIVGMALAVSAYGERGPALAALPVAMLTALYNVLAVWVLNTTLGSETSLPRVLLGIARNPLIIGIALGVVYSLSGIAQPDFIVPLSLGLSQFFLPLMLVLIGGSMTVTHLYRAGAPTWEAVGWRLCVAPLISVLVALGFGVTGEELGVLFLILATPVAASSYIMVIAAGGEGVRAANMVVLSTLLSVVTITAGFFLLSLLGLVGEW